MILPDNGRLGYFGTVERVLGKKTVWTAQNSNNAMREIFMC